MSRDGHLEPDGDDLVVEAPEPLPEPIMTELRAHKADLLDFLTRPVARVVLLHCPPGVPEEWVQGTCDLLAMTCPASCPNARWQTLREDVCLLKTPSALETVAFRTGTGYRPRHVRDCLSSPPFSTPRQLPWARNTPA